MKITIDTETLAKYNITQQEFFYLLYNIGGSNVSDIRASVVNKKLCSRDLFSEEQVVFDENNRKFISNLLIESNNTVQSAPTDFEDIAKAMRECYPVGKKEGTPYQWRDSVPIITKKLKTLVAVFDFIFTKEQAVEATKAYVSSFNGDYRYMQLLKYFILKNDKDTKEQKSEFMSYIENAGQESTANKDWTYNLV